MDLVAFSKLSLFCLNFQNNSLPAVLKSHQIHVAYNQVGTVALNKILIYTFWHPFQKNVFKIPKIRQSKKQDKISKNRCSRECLIIE